MKELTSEGGGQRGARHKWGSKWKMDNEGHKNVFLFQAKRLRNQVQSSDKRFCFFSLKDKRNSSNCCEFFMRVVRRTEIFVLPRTQNLVDLFHSG